MNPNDQIKLKVLQGLKSHMNNSAGQRLANRVRPKGMPAAEPAPVAAAPAPEAPGMPDDDKNRLLDLYSKLK